MKYLYIFLLIPFLFSCDDKQETEVAVKVAKPLMSIVAKHNPTKSIAPKFLKDVADWQKLKLVDSFFVNYRKISPNEALNNAVELKDLVKSLNDSIPEKFNIPSFKARVNVLYNETLRLADLTDIPAIKATEVNAQVDKTIEAFSAVNIKVNTILQKQLFEDLIDVDISFIGLDTTKIDSVSKQSIDLKLKEKLINKNNFDKGALKRQ
ncbi:hypothetical protein [Polaribacter sp.]|uniref:hypothetical protein n=1 Tax=Polaribacter sp. TaxID=1920175 RepID=UPI003F6ACC92